MPGSVCGWPSVYDGGLFPPFTVRLAQRILAVVLDSGPANVTGILTAQTTADINAFEALFGLTVNGKLNIDSWPTLLGQVTPLVAGQASGLPVEALQVKTVNEQA